jgi:hypothetical protein
MAAHDKDQVCSRLIQKFTTREPLDKADKDHLAACEDCMARVVRALEEVALQGKKCQRLTVGETNGESFDVRPEAIQALEGGRRVLEREFGIRPSRLARQRHFPAQAPRVSEA